MRLAGELLKNLEAKTISAALLPSGGGRFGVSVNGNLLYSKLQTGRHAELGEMTR